MISESFGDFKWVESPKLMNIEYVVDKDGKILGHIALDIDIYKAVHDYSVLGRYIDKKSAKKAIEDKINN